MTTRAVWSGLATVLTVSMGTAVAGFHGSPPSARAWILTCLWALSVVAAPVLAVRRTDPMRAAWRERRPVLIIALSTLSVSLAALGMLLYLNGSWPGVTVGVVVTLAAVLACCLFGSRLGWPPALASCLSTLALLAVGVPLVAFSVAAASIRSFPWKALPALLLLAAPFAASWYPELLEGLRPEREQITDRLLTVGSLLSSLAGIAATAALMPGSWELRLLALSPAAVVIATGIAAVLHPSASSARTLSGLLSSVSFCAVMAGISLVYAIA